MGICILFILLILYSCSDSPHVEEQVVTLQLSDVPDRNYQDMKQTDVQVVSLVPLELTDHSILGESCALIDDSLGRFVLKDIGTVYVFDNKGNYLSSISQRGEGPQQYYNIFDASVDWEAKQIHVFDYPSCRLLTYSIENGSFAQAASWASTEGMLSLGNGNWVVYNTPNDTVPYDLSIYDKDGKRIWGRMRQTENPGNNYQVLRTFYKSNNEVHIYENDTIFRVKKEGGLHPLFCINKGKLTAPTDVLYDIRKKQERNRYIWGESFCFSTRYCFLRFYYDNCIYSDVWDITAGKLCYRNIAHSPADKIGFPIQINDATIYVWPAFVKNDTFYCLIDEATTMLLFPEKGEDINPCILKIDLMPNK